MSLREILLGQKGSLRERLAGVAVAGAGAVTRSTTLSAKGAEMASAKPAEPTPEAKSFDPATDKEVMSQKMIARQTGWNTDDVGNPTSRLPLDERLQIAKTSPDSLNELLSKDEQKFIKVEVVEDKNLLSKVKRTLSGRDKEKKVTLPFEPREVEIIARPSVEKEELKTAPAFYPEDVKKDFVLAAKENNYDTAKLSAQMESEMGWFEPGYVKTDEGAVGQGQHRDIFHKEWNPKFKAKYGHDYDRKNPKDVFRATSLAMSEYMKRYDGSWEAALIAYNKGPSVVEDYINDPKYTFDDDPYVQGVKAKLAKYQQ